MRGRDSSTWARYLVTACAALALCYNYKDLKDMGYKRLGRIQIIFIGITGALMLAYGTVHLVHRGLQSSGTPELLAFLLLMLALLMPQKKMRSYHRLSWLQLVIIGLIAGVVLIYGIYHLSTPDGKLSGTLEMVSFALLALTIFLPRK